MVPGSVRWYVDAWGVPVRFIVDFVNASMSIVRGVSYRGAFVVVSVSHVFETLDQAEFYRGKRSFVGGV